MRHVLVTGGAGFIGSHVVDRLLAEGARVTVVDNFDPFYAPEIKRRNVAEHLDHKAYRLFECDVADGAKLAEALSGDYDAIIHLAAKAGVRPSIKDPAAYQRANIIGTQNLLELARQWEVPQFVFASSSSVYGINPNVPWREDDHVLQPISPYAATKVSGELLGHVYHHLYGLNFIALRFFTVYGPRQRPDLAIHKFARLMLDERPVPIYGDGSFRRDYTYIDDAVAGVMATLNRSDLGYDIINLGNNQTVSVLELVRSLEETLGKRAELRFESEKPGDVPQTWASLEKAQRRLGYRPVTTLDVGLRAFGRWLKDT